MRRERVGQRGAVAVGQAAHGVGVERARAGARAEQAAAEARALLVGPVDELERAARRCSGASARSTSSPATTLSAPSSQPPFGHRVEVAADDHEARRSRPGAVAHVLPASSVSTRHAVDRRRARARSHSRAVIQVSVQATRCAPSSSPVRRRAPAGPRPRGRRRRSPSADGRAGGGLRERAVHEAARAGLGEHLAVAVGELAAHVDRRPGAPVNVMPSYGV